MDHRSYTVAMYCFLFYTAVAYRTPPESTAQLGKPSQLYIARRKPSQLHYANLVSLYQRGLQAIVVLPIDAMGMLEITPPTETWITLCNCHCKVDVMQAVLRLNRARACASFVAVFPIDVVVRWQVRAREHRDQRRFGHACCDSAFYCHQDAKVARRPRVARLLVHQPSGGQVRGHADLEVGIPFRQEVHAGSKCLS